MTINENHKTSSHTVEYSQLTNKDYVYDSLDDFSSSDEEIVKSDEMKSYGFDETYLELVGSKKSLNYKKLGALAAIVLVVVTIIVVCVVLLTDAGENSSLHPEKQALSLEDIINGRLSPHRFNGSWVSETEILYHDPSNIVKLFDVDKLTTTTVLGNESEALSAGINFELSADKKYLLVAREYQKIFRHSYAAKYDVMDVETKLVTPLTIKGEVQPLLLAQWSPVDNSIAIVYENNIYYKPTALGNEIQITTDGSATIYNGNPDWVYEEEVFAANKAMWFSPDGKKLAFIRFDDSLVQLMHFPYYGAPGHLEFQYPKTLSIRYPKTGTPNPSVKLFEVVVDNVAVNPPLIEMLAPTELNGSEHIISTVSYSNNETLISIWMNRVQNLAYIQSCHGATCSTIKTVESSTGWVDIFTPPLYNSDGTKMALILSQSQGDAGNFRHLTIIDTTTNFDGPLTDGQYVVQEILHWDKEHDLIFYLANTQASAQVRHLFAIKATAGMIPQCLTCSLNYVPESPKQSYFSAEFNNVGKRLVLSAEGPNIPRADIYSWKYDTNVKLEHLLQWESNEEIQELVTDKGIPNQIFQTIELSSGFTANVLLSVPPNADLSGAVKYPLLIDVYGGPDTNNVLDKWSMDWGSYLVANRSIIIAKIDGRGSGLRGDRLMHTIYRKFGTVEVLDQIETARKLKDKLPYIDGNRMAIWGWSYGGYASAMALVRDTEQVFKCAASVAPVTDWMYYDSIYTERYMGLPLDTDNALGYLDSRLSTLADGLRNKTFLLVHGTFDDNVHFQQSMALARILERRDILFKQLSYPDEDHSLAGVRPHLYHSMGRFFGECFEMGDL